ncbi:MAG: glycerophosphodiester phosphodiesterase [Chloroflexi bacterium]|nr:glycerophosphodiester phosphodiesterase [Chloroflexota bacterium]
MSHRLIRTVLLAALTLLSATVVFAQPPQPSPDHPFIRNDDFLVIAHRGGAGLRPENTLAAFEHAVELGVDVLEMDVFSTADGVLVTIHDDTVDRTTDGTGRVQDFTFAELQTLDAGYTWPTIRETDGEAGTYRGQGITIPALEEVFETFPDTLMSIEIKQREPSIVAPLCDLIREHDLAAWVVIGSFHEDAMAEFRAACPEVPTSGVESEISSFFTANLLGGTDDYTPISRAFQLPEYFGELPLVTPSFVRNANRRGIGVYVWTINEPETMAELIDIGVNGIITDYPDELLALVPR